MIEMAVEERFLGFFSANPDAGQHRDTKQLKAFIDPGRESTKTHNHGVDAVLQLAGSHYGQFAVFSHI